MKQKIKRNKQVKRQLKKKYFVLIFLFFSLNCIKVPQKNTILMENIFILEVPIETVWDNLMDLIIEEKIPVLLADKNRFLISSNWLSIDSLKRYRYSITLEKNNLFTILSIFVDNQVKAEQKWISVNNNFFYEKALIKKLKERLNLNGQNR